MTSDSTDPKYMSAKKQAQKNSTKRVGVETMSQPRRPDRHSKWNYPWVNLQLFKRISPILFYYVITQSDEKP